MFQTVATSDSPLHVLPLRNAVFDRCTVSKDRWPSPNGNLIFDSTETAYHNQQLFKHDSYSAFTFLTALKVR